MNFLEKYTSNEAQTKIKYAFQGLKNLSHGNLLFKNGLKIVKKLRLTPLIFWRNLAILGTFLKDYFLEKYTFNVGSTQE